jgi:hypothetical protein
MSADHLDRSIEAVAKRLVNVQEDAGFATRIASALPERRWRFLWLVPQLGVGAAIAIAAFVWFNREAPKLAETTIAMVPFRAPVDAVEPFRPIASAFARERSGELRRDLAVAANGREGGPVAPAALATRVEDHERALPAVEGPAVLAFSDLGPRDLPGVAPLTLPSLEIGELPLTGEAFPPREY